LIIFIFLEYSAYGLKVVIMFNFKVKTYKVFESKNELEELLSGKSKAKLKGRWAGFFVLKERDQYYLIRNKCPHQKKPLFDGSCENGTWVCPWHQYHFDLENGRGHGTYLERYKLFQQNDGLYFSKEVFSLF
jgi:nitrite reductase/ring-hydroxylating ferredoxin subunit